MRGPTDLAGPKGPVGPAGWLGLVLNARLTLSLKMSTLLILLVFTAGVASIMVRNRVSTKYSRLPRELDSAEEDDQNLADMLNDGDRDDEDALPGDKPAPSHFDEFLKAIKVFGFLEPDVFNELTKSMQTLRIQQGESVRLARLDGFAVVITGAMKVYCQSEHEEQGEYDLLNEVAASAPISSLSSILSLFTEDVLGEQQREAQTAFDRVNATVFAVASEPSTIVVIPAHAFRHLTRRFPLATANIVQVILFRWSQVTFRTCQRYLNLTRQFYGTEQLLNEANREKCSLPKWLVDDAVHRLKTLASNSRHESIVELAPVSSPPKPSQTTPSASARQRRRSVDIRPSFPSRRSSSFSGTANGTANGTSNSTANGTANGTAIGTATAIANGSAHASSVEGPHPHPDRKAFPTYSSEKLSTSPSTPSSSAARERRQTPLPDFFQPSAPSFHSQPIPGGSLSASLSNIAEFTQINARPTRDSIDTAVRRAIVQSMFAIIGFDSRVSRSRSDESDDENTKASLSSHTSEGLQGIEVHPAGSFGLPMHTDTAGTSSKASSPSSSSESEAPAHSYSEILDAASDAVELLWYHKGEQLSQYGGRCRGLVYVLDGTLEVGYHASDQDSYQRLYDVDAGNVTGFLETVSSYSAFVDLVAKTDVCVAIINKTQFEQLADAYPLLYITAAKTLTTSLTRPIVQLDFALEWITVKSGGRLLTEGQAANAIYFVLNGRMRAYQDHKLLGDFGHGSTIGELETLTGEKYAATLVAVRDTELSRFPRTLVECLTRQYPSITFEMSKMVVQAMRTRQSITEESNYSDFKTLTVLPTAPDLPVEEFAVKLSSAFEALGRDVKVLTSSVILRYLGKRAFQRMGVLRLKAYLTDLEDQFSIVLYVADSASSSEWTRTCIEQADCVLLMADAAAQPTYSDAERMVVKSRTRSRNDLILLHNHQLVPHGSTAKWLKNRPWIRQHHHIYMDFVREESTQVAHLQQNRVKRKLHQIKNRVQDELRLLQQRKILRRHQQHPSKQTRRMQYKNDFSRLARVLAGEAVGLVLGGGGARGVSHIGVLQALEEAGVPIDMVGGTSIGSLIGGLYARDYDIVPLLSRAKQFSVRIASFWRVLMDLTYPVTAWTTGHAFNRAVWKSLGDSRIEDFWVKYFCNTTNLTMSRMEIHQKGYAWRYIRASMSLAGLLPPLEERGQMLLDGGYVDNLPVTEMKRMGARHIIAVDVGAVDDTTPLNYGDSLSGFWALINRWNPLSSTPNVPNLAEIQQRLTYVSSVKALEEAKVTPSVIYLRPPIDHIATLDFGKFDEIVAVGYDYATKALEEKVSSGELPTMRSMMRENSATRSTVMYRRHSF